MSAFYDIYISLYCMMQYYNTKPLNTTIGAIQNVNCCWILDSL